MVDGVVGRLVEETLTIHPVMVQLAAIAAIRVAGAGVLPDAVAETTLAVHHTVVLPRPDVVAMGGERVLLEKVEDEEMLVDAVVGDGAEAGATAVEAAAGHTLVAEAVNAVAEGDRRNESPWKEKEYRYRLLESWR